MSKDKKKFYTPKEIKAIEDEGASKGIALTLASFMDEFEMDKDDLSRGLTRLIRYTKAVDSHLISIKKVVDIIREETDLPINW